LGVEFDSGVWLECFTISVTILIFGGDFSVFLFDRILPVTVAISTTCNKCCYADGTGEFEYVVE
jgi:hypothetical protein